MRDYGFQLAPGETARREVLGRFARVKSASADLQIKAEDREGRIVADLTAGPGMRFAVPGEFVRLRVTNKGEASLDAVLTVGYGEVDDSSIVGSLDVKKSQSIRTMADQVIAASGAVTVAADTTRRELILQALEGNTGPVRVGDSSVGSTQGVLLYPGQSLVLDSAAAVTIGNFTGDSQTVAVLEVLD